MNIKKLLAAALPGAIVLACLAPVRADAPRRTGASRPPRPTKTAPAITPALSSGAPVKQLLASAPAAKDFPNAGKATLLDLADIQVRPDGSSRTVTRQLIKVFNERGRDEAEVQIPYNSAFETVTVTRARTIKPGGQVVSVKPADIRDDSASEGDNSYSDARVKSFSLPAVDSGCLLDYEYVTEQKKPEMPGQFWTQWWFQAGTDPVMESRLTVTIPKSLALNQKLRNTPVKPMVKPSADGKNVRYVWVDKNIAPIEPEPMMPGPDRIAPSLSVSTLDSWQAVAAWYWKLAQNRMNADATIKAQTAALIKNKNTPEEKAKAIFYNVEEKTRYVALEYGMAGYQPRPAGDVCRNQYGDCKDMATLLVAMLREAGITAHPVLLRAGSTTKIRDELPAPGAFNHAICQAEIDGKKYWLDATAEICPWGVIPDGDRGADAFVIRNGVGTFETIPPASPTENQVEQAVTLRLAADGSATGTVRMTGTGDMDLGLRGALTYLRPDKVRDFVERMARSIGPNARVSNYKISDFRNKDQPLTITYDIVLPSWAKKSGDLLLFKARAEQSAGASSSPFGDDNRRHAIFQSSGGMAASTVEVTLPEGFEVLSLPENTTVKSDLGQLLRTVERKDNTLTIGVRAEHYRADIPASRYAEVQKYYNDYLAASEETIVLKKG